MLTWAIVYALTHDVQLGWAYLILAMGMDFIGFIMFVMSWEVRHAHRNK